MGPGRATSLSCDAPLLLQINLMLINVYGAYGDILI